MSFSLEQLLNNQMKEQLAKSKNNHVGSQKYAVKLEYEKHPNGQPIHTRICKVHIEHKPATHSPSKSS